MARNLIPEVARMLGVKLGEEFKIKGCNKFTYKFDSDKLMVTCCDNMEITAIVVSGIFAELLSGEREIIKLRWEPQLGETYYSFSSVYDKWVVLSYTWKKKPWQYALLNKGWVYRTREEAKDTLPDIAKELGVEYTL